MTSYTIEEFKNICELLISNNKSKQEQVKRIFGTDKNIYNSILQKAIALFDVNAMGIASIEEEYKVKVCIEMSEYKNYTNKTTFHFFYVMVIDFLSEEGAVLFSQDISTLGNSFNKRDIYIIGIVMAAIPALFKIEGLSIPINN